MIQALMLIGLGFFAATLLALLVAPAAWARAVRITSHRIRSSLPINETEIRAEKDQLRAGHAVTVHRLEKKIERAEMSAARQRVELNRREARIVELEEAGKKLADDRDENRNARSVLAQTLNERLPRAEERLRETRELLDARDVQIAKFVRSATQQHRALAEANAMIRQQDADLDRMKAAMTARQSADRQRVPSEALEQTLALQGEVSELRARNATQSKLIERIQEAERTRAESDAAREAALKESPAADPGARDGGAIPMTAAGSGEKSGFLDRFNRYKAALLREKETTARLRTELASAHDRAARLSSHYREELRTLTHNVSANVGAYESRLPQPVTERELRASSDAGPSAHPYRESARALSKVGAQSHPLNGGGENGHAAAQAASTGGTRVGLAARLASQSGGEPKTAAVELPTAVTGGPARQTTLKSGTLLQRLKGYEDNA
ncbi:MAG: hypothetical protein AAGJ70_02290 [Pseudomonadota bacterium]